VAAGDGFVGRKVHTITDQALAGAGRPGDGLTEMIARGASLSPALHVRDYYDALEVRVPDAPLPDEVIVIAAVANRGRRHARCGGLAAGEIRGKDGLR